MPQGPQPLTISQVNKAGKLLRHHICGEQVLDAAQYDAALDVVRDRADVDIVLVGSDSLETVKLTHANYFSGAASVSRLEAHLRQMLEESMSRRSSPATMVSRGGQSAAG